MWAPIGTPNPGGARAIVPGAPSITPFLPYFTGWIPGIINIRGNLNLDENTTIYIAIAQAGISRILVTSPNVNDPTAGGRLIVNPNARVVFNRLFTPDENYVGAWMAGSNVPLTNLRAVYNNPQWWVNGVRYVYWTNAERTPNGSAVFFVTVGRGARQFPNPNAGNQALFQGPAADPDFNVNALAITAVNGSPNNIGQTITTSIGTSFLVNSDGSFDDVPPSNFIGEDSVTVTVSDGVVSKDFTLSTNITEGAPELPNAEYPSAYNAGVTVESDDFANLLWQGSNFEMPDLEITAVNGSAGNVGTQITTSAGGTLTINADGSLAYGAPPNYAGDDSASCTVSDGVNTLTAAVTFQVIDVYAYGAEYSTLVGQPLSVASDPDGLLHSAAACSGNALSVVGVNGSAGGVGSMVATAAGGTVAVQANGGFIYSPPENFQGDDSFTVTIGTGNSSVTETVTLHVVTVLAHDAEYSTVHDHALTVASGAGLLAHVSQSGNNALSIVAINGDAAAVGQSVNTDLGGTIVVQSNGSFVYTPPAHTIGDDYLSYTASDGVSTSTAWLALHKTNHAPTVSNASFTTQQDQSLSVSSMIGLLMYGSDPDWDSLTVVAVDYVPLVNNTLTITSTHGGILTVHAVGSFTYTPAAGWYGDDTFTFALSDGIEWAWANLTIHVSQQLGGPPMP